MSYPHEGGPPKPETEPINIDLAGRGAEQFVKDNDVHLALLELINKIDILLVHMSKITDEVIVDLGTGTK